MSMPRRPLLVRHYSLSKTYITAHKVALDPNNKQIGKLRQHCGAARVAYNHALNDFKAGLDKGEWRSGYDLQKRFNTVKGQEYPWMREVSTRATAGAISALADAVKHWHQASKQRKSGKSKRYVGFPKYRSIKRTGYRYKAEHTVGRVRTDGKRVKLPKIGWIRTQEESRFTGPVRQCWISERAGRWYATLTYEIELDTPERTAKPKLESTLGIDVGIKTLATLSDGTEIVNPKPLKSALARLRQANKRLSRRKRGSKRRERARLQLAKAHARVSDIRNDHHHKTTTAIAKRSDVSVIGVETLKIANLSRNRRLSRAFADAGIAEWLRMLAYKCDREGIVVESVIQWLPSSKTCHWCGSVNDRLTLAVRDWRCADCKRGLGRDLNAARNIRQAAWSAVSGRGDYVRPTFGSAAVCEASTYQSGLTGM